MNIEEKVLQFAICAVIILAWWFWFKKFGILDKPGKDIPARNPVPNFQWIWIIVAFLVIVGVFYPQYIYEPKILGMFVGILLLFVLSIGDDFVWYFNKLKWRPASTRLILQLLIISISIYISGIYSDLNIFGIQIPAALSFIFGVLRIGMFINSINRFDGYNLGISSIVSTVGFLTIYILIQYIILPWYIGQNINDITVLNSVANLWLMLAFLWICSFLMESKPFGVIRDVGIMFYGFCLGYLSLAWGAKVGMLLTALGLPLLDSIRTVANRIFVMKKNPMKWDWTHLHYRLLAMWRSKNEIRSFVFLRSVFFMNIGIMQGLDRINKFIIFFWMAILFFGVNIYIYRYKKMPYEYKPKWIETKDWQREF